MRIKGKILWMLLLPLFLSWGCKVGKNYHGTEIIVPERFYLEDPSLAVDTSLVNTDTLEVDSLAAIQWWGIFEDPVLDSLIQVALLNNQDLNIALESIIQASYMLQIQRREMLPKIDLQAGYARGNYQGIRLPDPTNNVFVTGNLKWELDFFGKLRRLNEAAMASYISTVEGTRALKISLVAGIAQTYFNMLEFKALWDISERTLRSRDSVLYIVERRFEEGIIPQLDVDQSQIQQAIAASAVPFYRRQFYQSENALHVLLGDRPGAIEMGVALEDQDINIDIPMGLPSELLFRRPDLVAAEQELIAANAFVGVAQAQRLPSISLTGLLGLASDDLSDLTSNGMAWNIGGGLFGPLFYWGQNAKRVKIEKSRRNQAVLNYQASAINAFREVEDALIQIATLKEELKATQVRVTAADHAEMLSFQRYDKGVTSYLEYLEQQRQAFDAAQILISTKSQLLSSYVNLYKVLGGGWDL
ncbi:efflux transporter outer membrane subunit [Echinicola shivajiensis]|uniref:efflux transporter outer membrane subunit n=1 Tax=Echinicola shivajiensis TaxID=1035916 RepID=UPI001BFC01B7|nr:efflux transporter outer membrane subunit [Echinicola shivajiensis]